MTDSSNRNDAIQQAMRKAALEIQRLRLAYEGLEQRLHEPVAIIGMACRYPGGANTPALLWQNLKAGHDAITETAARWRQTAPGEVVEITTAMRWGGLLDDVQHFDAAFFGISPREAVKLDPQQRLCLEVAWEALENAGVPADKLVGTPAGVYLGCGMHDYERILLSAAEKADVYTITGSENSFIAGRVAYALGLQGPAITLNTACSSSLVAIHLACQGLRNRDCEVALSGGVQLLTSPESMTMEVLTQALSPEGRCRTFDAKANGYVRGEGVAMLVLKRLADAQRDGDAILGLVRGSAVNQDGRSAGLTAPNGQAQVTLFKKALSEARVEPQQVSYIEAHGTGTPLGDPIEMESIRTVYGAPRADGSACVVGSIKTNIGHTECAAGVAGVIKTLLAMQHETVPKHLHFQTLNPMIDLQGTALVIPTTEKPWKRGPQPRIAAVSSFGLSGTNSHVLVQEAPPAALSPVPADTRAHMLVLSARSPESLKGLAQRYVEALAGPLASVPMADVAYNAGTRRAHLPHRLVTVGATHAQLVAGLRAHIDGQKSRTTVTGVAGTGRRPTTVFVFPGQGSQWLGMGRTLLNEEPVFKQAMEACDAAIQKRAGWSAIAELQATQDASRLGRIDVVQPTLFALQVSLAALWRAWGVIPDTIIGHSMGEVAAAHVAGALSLDDAVRVICLRSALMRRVAGQGAMVVVDMSLSDAEALIKEHKSLCVAVYNGAQSQAIAGDVAGIEALEAQLKPQNIFCARVKTDVAFHSPHMDALMPELQQGLQGMVPMAPTVPLISTVTGEAVTQAVHDAAYWLRNLRDAVRFAQATQALLPNAAFVEISAHPTLVPVLAHALQTGEGHTGVAVGSLRRDTPDRQSLLTHAGALYAHGMALEVARQHMGARSFCALPTYAWNKSHYWIALPEGGLRAHPALREDGAITVASAPRHDAGAFLQQTWEALPTLEDQPDANDAGTWLILGGDALGFGTAVQSALAARGAQVVQLLPSADNARAISTCLEQLKGCRGIVHLWSLIAPQLTQDPVRALSLSQELVCDSTVHLVQTLLRLQWRDLPRLWLVADPAAPEQGALWGLGRTIGYEQVNLNPTLVHASIAPGPLGAQHMAEHFVRELLADPPEQELTLQGEGVRLGGRLTRRRPTAKAAPQKPRCHGDAAYLVTGGLGALGQTIAAWLVEQGAGCVVLADTREATAVHTTALANLTHGKGHLVPVKIDVSDRAQVVQLMQRFGSDLRPLRGVIHAASVMDDAPLGEQTPARFAKALAPKMRGGWWLHEVTQKLPLDFFVLYSSVSSFLGSPTESNDAAANAFLDALAHFRRAQKLPAVSINWGPYMPPSATPKMRMSQRGVHFLTAAEGLDILGEVLDADVTQVGAVSFDGRQVVEYFPQLANSRRYQTLMAVAVTETQEARGPSEILQRLQQERPEARLPALQQFIREQLAAVLGLAAASIRSQTPFTELGLDSLMGLELRNNLEAALNLQLSASMVYGYPNVAALTQYAARELNLKTAPEPEEAPAEAPTAVTHQEARAALLAELAATQSELND